MQAWKWGPEPQIFEDLLHFWLRRQLFHC